MLLAMLDSMETLPQLRFLAETEVFSARVDIAQQRENRCRLPTPVLASFQRPLQLPRCLYRL